MRYHIIFRVKGDHIAPDLEIRETLYADSLDDLAKGTWKSFCKCTYFIWKRMESGVFMEPRPNSLMSIECDQAEEMEIFDAFFNLRIDRYNKMKGKYNVR